MRPNVHQTVPGIHCLALIRKNMEKHDATSLIKRQGWATSITIMMSLSLMIERRRSSQFWAQCEWRLWRIERATAVLFAGRTAGVMSGGS